MSWIVYILKCSDESLYTGITNNLEKRLQLHASGKGSKYTRGRGPLELVHQERFKTRSLASKRELFIKKLNRLDKIKLYND